MAKPTKKLISVEIDQELLDRLDKWLSRQEVRPKKKAVHETALRRFLDTEEITKNRKAKS